VHDWLTRTDPNNDTFVTVTRDEVARALTETFSAKIRRTASRIRHKLFHSSASSSSSAVGTSGHAGVGGGGSGGHGLAFSRGQVGARAPPTAESWSRRSSGNQSAMLSSTTSSRPIPSSAPVTPSVSPLGSLRRPDVVGSGSSSAGGSVSSLHGGLFAAAPPPPAALVQPIQRTRSPLRPPALIPRRTVAVAEDAYADADEEADIAPIDDGGSAYGDVEQETEDDDDDDEGLALEFGKNKRRQQQQQEQEQPTPRKPVVRHDFLTVPPL
jgi:hypothetical protein